LIREAITHLVESKEKSEYYFYKTKMKPRLRQGAPDLYNSLFSEMKCKNMYGVSLRKNKGGQR